MTIRQGSPGLLCRCTRCHSVFKLYSYHTESDAPSSEFECDCGRTIKVEETTTAPACKIDEAIVAPSLLQEMERK